MQEIVEIRQNAISLIRKMFDMPVELGTEECVEHLKANSACNNCFSYTGCCLVLTILNWVAETYPDDYHKEGLRNYIKGLSDGYFFGTTGVPRTITDETLF